MTLNLQLNKNKQYIAKFLVSYHKKTRLYKIISLYYLFICLIGSIYNTTIFKYINDIYFIRYLYIFFLKNTQDNYKSITYKAITYKAITYKLYNLSIISEQHGSNSYINIINIKNNYFSTNNDLIIFISLNYKLKINLWFYLLYGKYLEYVTAYLYNLYLNTNCFLLNNYPLINIILRFLMRSRLSKLIHFKKFKHSKIRIFTKYKVYEVKLLGNKFRYNFQCNNLANIYSMFKNIKLFKLLSKLDIFKNLRNIFLRFLRNNFLYSIYSINIYNDYDNSLGCEYNKFNVQGLYSLYFQLRRYGFNVVYYFFYFNIYNILNSFSDIKKYNLYLYNNLLFLNRLNYLLWYKIKKIIVLNYIKNSFLRFLKSNRFIIKIKRRKRIIVRKWRLLLKMNNLLFFPLDLKFYNNNKLINHIIKSKQNLEYLCNLSIFKYKYKSYQRYSISFINIIKDINLDINIINNYYKYQCFFINILKNKLNKFYIMNLFNLLSIIKIVYIKTLIKLKILVPLKVIFGNFQDRLDYNLNLYYISRDISLNKFVNLYIKYKFWYIWKFEHMLISCMYIKYMFHLYMFIFLIFSSYILLNINIFNIINIEKNKLDFTIRFLIKSNKPNSIIYNKYTLNKYIYSI